MSELIQTIVPYIPSAAIPLVICVCFAIYIQSKRKETKSERDKDSTEIHDKLLKHDFEIAALKDEIYHQRNIQDDISKQINTLSESVAKFSVAVDMLSESVKEIRNEIRRQ